MPPKKNESQRKRKSEQKENVASKVQKKELLQSPSKSGHVLTIGQGDVGQLGLGEDIMERKRPALLKEVDDIDFVQVTSGGMHSVAVTENGEVYSWGCNDDGALGRATNDGEEFFAKKVPLKEGLKIVLVSAGDSHTAALSVEGDVYAWGAYRDASGQIGLTAASIGAKNEIIKIYPKQNQASDPAVKIVSGNDHTVILTREGNIYTSGTGEQGQLGRIKECFGHRGGRRGLDFILAPQIVRFRKKIKFSDIFAGSFCTFALCRDSHDVYAWGLNNYGQLGSGTTDNYFNPEIIKQLSILREKNGSNLEIHGGQHHSILVDGKGQVYSIGRAEYGRLGIGEDATETSVPVKVTTLSEKKVVSVACGETVSFAITSEGHLYSWGLGTSLQLGVGDEEDICVPTLVKSKQVDPDQNEVISSSAGGQHTALLVRKRTKPISKNEP